MGLHYIMIDINMPYPNPAVGSLRIEVLFVPLVLLAVSTQSAHSRPSVLDRFVSVTDLFSGPEVTENS